MIQTMGCALSKPFPWSFSYEPHERIRQEKCGCRLDDKHLPTKRKSCFRCQGVKPAPNCNCIRWIYALYMLGRCQGGVKEVSSLGVLVWIHRLSNKHCMTSPSLLNGRLISIELKAFRHWMTDTLSRTRKTWLVQLAVSIIHPIACYVGVQIFIFIICIAYWCRVCMWCKGV